MSLRVGVIGTGALGRHHVRILSELDGVELAGVCDKRSEIGEAMAAQYGCRHFADADALFRELDAVVIAVPTVAHEAETIRALAAGCHVLVEKPMAASLEQADRMLAAAGDRVLAVGHVEFYNPAVQGLLSAVRSPRFVVIERLSTFTPRSLDVDVLLDLMIHDLQILQALDGSEVREVRAVGIDVLSARVDIASARLELASGCVAQLTASRVSEQRVRRLRVFSPAAYHSLDYQEQSIKGYHLADGEDGARTIVPGALAVERGEPLRRELECFTRRCRGEQAPLVDGAQGRSALHLALEVQAAIGRRPGSHGGVGA